MKSVLFFCFMFCVGFAFAAEVSFNGQVFDLHEENVIDSDYLMKDVRFLDKEPFCLAESRGDHAASFNCVLFKDKVLTLGGRNINLGEFDLNGGVILVNDVPSDYIIFGEDNLQINYDVNVFYVDPSLNFVFADIYFGRVDMTIKKDLNEEGVDSNDSDDSEGCFKVGIWKCGVDFLRQIWAKVFG